MNRTHKIIGALTIATLFTFGSDAMGEDGVKQINRANQALLDGKVAEALAQYQLVEQSAQPSPLLAYNKGVALYQQGQIEQARQSFTHAMDTDDPELAAQAAFNLGNCQYANAISQAETERNIAIESLQTAIAHYRSALQINPSDLDARTNIELARQLIQHLREEEQQQQQDQQQQDQQQQDQQPCENQDCQNQESDESQQNQDDSSDSESQQSDEQSSDDSQSNEDQSDGNSSKQDESESEESMPEEAESEGSESNESDSNESNEEDSPSDQNATSKSEAANEEPGQDSSAGQEQDQEQSPQQPADQQQPQPGEQQQPESEPGQETPGQETQEQREPGQDMSAGSIGQQDQQPDGEQTNGYAFSQTGEPGENIEEEEALKMLQAIRDRDLMRRMKKLNEARRRYRPVDRDW